ncbi:MAG TPA: EamA family transporter [Pseudonocardia sp.]|jgi:inner membrane transporter RhtA|nr:EamA family transporter [Pseudonocardia sp.]
MVLGAALSVQFGAAVAALLFARVGVAGAVTLRLVVAAAVLLVVCRPGVRGYGRRDWLLVGGFGLSLAGMNTLLYTAISRIPLGVAVTCEVLGPLTLSVVAGRRVSSWLCALLALAGVVLLGEGRVTALDPLGVGCAFGAAVFWAAYILLSARTGARFPKVDGLALAMAAAALLTLPLGVGTGRSALLDPMALGLGALVAGLSSVLPYTFELRALRRLPTPTFAVLMSLGPAIAALAGYLVLGQRLSPVQALAVALVVTASAAAVRTAARGGTMAPGRRATAPRPPRSAAGRS